MPVNIGGLFFSDNENHFQTYANDIYGYQRPQRLKAFEYVRNWECCVDGGANVGIFSIDFAKKFKTVYSFEPLSQNIECLKLNLPENAQIMPYALGDAPGHFDIFLTPDSLGGAFIANHEKVERPTENFKKGLKERVELRTLDSFNLKDVGLIKLDIQGAEFIALQGAKETIARCRPVVLIEEKPIGGPTGSVETIKNCANLLINYGMTPKEKVGADRIYVFE